MLRRIILENFMSHARTEIDLADGLTVLTGPNNCGKSAVVAALQILATNGRSKHVMRHGAKFCRVTVETDDGHTICWERKKSTVKYTLDGEDIHRVGTSIPESLHELLRLDRVEADTGKTKHEYDIHFGEQKSPIFLLGETGSRAASFFASSSDASRLVEMQHRHRRKLRDQRTEAKRLNAESTRNTARLKSFEPIDVISKRIAKADSDVETMRLTENRIHRLEDLLGQLSHGRSKNEQLSKEGRVLARLDDAATTPADLERFAQTLTRLNLVVSDLSDLKRRCNTQCSLSASLAPLTPVPELHRVGRIRALIDNLISGTHQKHAASVVLNCCFTLKPPPEMERAIACRRILDQLRTAVARRRMIDNTSRALLPIQPAPVQDNPAALKSLILQLSDVGRRQQTTGSVQTAFGALREPPQIVATSQLRQLAGDLKRQQQKAFQLSACLKSLTALDAPTDEINLSDLSETIRSLKKALNAVASAAKRADAARQHMVTCETEIRQFVEANPKCATCGARIDPDTLLSAVPAIHDHPLTSISDADRSGHE
jgi:AAA ATPase domain